MLTDAHCHPFDLARRFPGAEQERRELGVMAAASACDQEEFARNEKLALDSAAENAAPLKLCFAVHPQQPAAENVKMAAMEKLLETLDDLASNGRVAAVGECGFDLFNAAFRETEKIQEKIFESQMEIALRYNLPVVIHARRAAGKIFAYSARLAKSRAVVFHSWPGTYEESQALLRRGVNALFSFGNTVLNGHKHAIRCCSLLPAERLMTETDAPYQPVKTEDFSRYSNLPQIIETIAAWRAEAGKNISAEQLETQIEENFRGVFC